MEMNMQVWKELMREDYTESLVDSFVILGLQPRIFNVGRGGTPPFGTCVVFKTVEELNLYKLLGHPYHSKSCILRVGHAE
jgi:hypothetical protein